MNKMFEPIACTVPLALWVH